MATEVVPIFSNHGCNAGGCHGKAIGQNGFKMSLLGFDPAFDHDALVREGRGRRVFPAAPEASLLVRKATATIPHGGGRKFAVGSPDRRTLGRKAEQQRRVEARYADGRVVDVTRLAQDTSNSADLATVDSLGLVKTLENVGEAAIMVRDGG